MKIRQLQLKNIGPFDDETIEFKACPAKDKAEIHILTGQNGSGKTTILQVIAAMFDDLEERTGFDFKHIPYVRNSLYKKFRKFEYLDTQTEEYQSYAKAVLPDRDILTIFGCPTCNSVHQKPLYTHNLSKSLLHKLTAYKYKLVGFGHEFEMDFAVFAISGYRQIENDTVLANYLPKNFNPLSQSLNFIKDYRKEGEITINQLVANNISNRALSKEDGSLEEAMKYDAVISAIENFIDEVTGWKVKFVLKRSPNELKLKIQDEELDFDVLPDGLRSLISWIADLLGRVDLLKWQDDLPITEKNLILLLDEIEVHLHPAWQRKVLPVVQKLFKNSQIFVSTHSPFVVNSVDDAWVYELDLKDGKAKVREKSLTKTTESVQATLEEIFEVPQIFGDEVQKDLDRFYELRNKVKNNGGKADKEFREIAKRLLKKSAEQNSAELQSIVAFELRQLKYEL